MVPSGTRRAAQVVGRVGAEKVVGFHGERGHAIARAFKKSGHAFSRADEAGPERLLLQRIEDEAGFSCGGMVLPGGTEEGLEVEDRGSWPGGKALSAAFAIESALKPAGSAFAGGDDCAAGCEPGVNFHSRISLPACPHSSVIRHWRGQRQSGLWRRVRVGRKLL